MVTTNTDTRVEIDLSKSTYKGSHKPRRQCQICKRAQQGAPGTKNRTPDRLCRQVIDHGPLHEDVHLCEDCWCPGCCEILGNEGIFLGCDAPITDTARRGLIEIVKKSIFQEWLTENRRQREARGERVPTL